MPESVEWRLFEDEFGPITLHERIDAAAALIAHTVWKAAGQEGDIGDFMPTWQREGAASAVDWLKAMAT